MIHFHLLGEKKRKNQLLQKSAFLKKKKKTAVVNACFSSILTCF